MPLQLVEKVCFFKKVLVLNPYPLKDTLMALPRAKLGVSLFRHPCRKPLPRGEGLCMLGWLCVSAIVVVCCRCVLHRLCSTTCMRPCIEPLGIHARHPCRGYITGATAPSPCWGLRPKARMLWLLAKSFARCKTSRASNTRHPILKFQRGLLTV